MNEREQMELNEQLMNAAQEGKVGQTMELIEAGADVNAENRKGETPLYVAAVGHFIDMAKILIKYIMLRDYHTTKPDYIVNNSKLSEFWDLCKNEVSGRLSNSTISVYQVSARG